MKIKKRIFIIEDYPQLKLMEDLFNRHVRKNEYELETCPDLSDDRIYKRHLPEGYDIYWMHGPSIEFDAINEIKEKQPWSKIVVRNGGLGDAAVINQYVEKKKVNMTISRQSGLDERMIKEILNNFGVKLEFNGEIK